MNQSNTPTTKDKAPVTAEERNQLVALMDVLERADDPALMARFRKITGSAGATQHRKTKRRVRNEDVRNTVLSAGEAVHTDDFKPIPPEHVVNLGDEAVAMWQKKWEDGFQVGEHGGFSDEDLYQFSADAQVGAIPGR